MRKLLIRLAAGVLALVVLLTLLVSGAILAGRGAPRPRMLAYVHSGAGVFIIDAARAQSQRLVDDSSVDINLVWSPDGDHLAFVSRRHGSGEIYVASVIEPSRLIRLSKNSAEDNSPAWAADGAWLTFVSSRTGAQDIFISDIEGERLRNLTQSYSSEFRPAWSPDGKRIALVAQRDNNYEMFVLDVSCLPDADDCQPDRTMMHNLSLNPLTDETPIWSPDSRWLAFVSLQGDNFAALRQSNYEVYAVDLACLDELPHCVGSAVNLTRHSAYDRAPVWSPDGEMIAFVSERDLNSEIYVVKTLCLLRGEHCDFQPRNLTEHPASDYNPVWSPDGTEIAFVSTRDGASDIYLLETTCLHRAVACPVRRLTINSFVYAPVWRP